MADKSVVREDIVQVSFEVNDSPLQEMVDTINEIKTAITGGVDGVQDFADDILDASDDVMGSVSEMTDGVNDFADSVKDSTSGFDNIIDSCDSTTEAVENITSSVNDLDNEIDAAEDSASDFKSTMKKITPSEIENLKKPIEEVTQGLGSAKEEGAGFVTKMSDIGKSGAVEGLENIKNATKGAGEGFESSGDAGVSFADMVGGALQAVGITLTLKGITDAAYELADAFSEAESIVVQATGATGEALDGLTQSMMNVYATSKTGSLNDVASAVGEINTRLGYTGEQLEHTTDLFVDFSAVTGQSTSSAVKNVTQLMNQWGISGDKMESTLDKLTYAGQASGIKVDTLSSQLLNNKAILDELGFSMDEATAMFMNFELAGTNTSQVLMGFRTALANGSISSLDDLRVVFNKLTDGTMSAEEASKMFGARAGVTIKNAAEMGVFSLDDFVAALGDTGGLLNQTAEDAQTMAQKWEQSTKGIKTAFTSALQPIIEKITDGLTGMLSTFGEFLQKNPAVVKAITAVLVALGGLASFKLVGSITKNFKGISSIFSGFGGGKSAKDGVGGVSGLFESLAKIKPTTILKGIANLAIIIGGVTAIAAGLMAIAPYMAQLSDVQSLMKVLGVITAIGIIGTVLSKMAGIVGKIPVSDVALGLANIAIIIAGMAALYLLIGAVSLINFDLKRILKISLILGVLGTVGAALSVFAALVGMIPIPAVLLGLANIAIVVAGMSALYLLIGAVSLIDFDLNRIMKIVEIIAVLGTVGAVLSVFAGIVGMIPIPVVLTGLANIALVLAGMTAVIVAFGALSEIPHFNDFITKGGETLANLFNQIGKIVGSLAGGLAEGITNSLPAIGQNLSDFAATIEPLITTFSDADMSGISTFFTAIGSFLLQMAGSEALSFFTGGLDLTSFGTELSTFADSASEFFNKVATLPENGFTNATALFQSFADIGNIPNTGGVAQWFTGTTDYAALADGLIQLSSEGVLGFFSKMAGLSPDGFENAKKMFQSLADIGNIPNTGGVAQWFTGTNDFAAVAEGLPPLGQAMAEFYTSIAPISDFNKISELFKALSGIGEAFPNTGGVAQWFTGENDISGVGTKLKEFGNSTKEFFSSVTALNVDNLKGVFEAVKSAGEIAKTDLSGLPDKGTQLSTFMTSAQGFFNGAGEITSQIEAVNSVATALQNFFMIVSGIVATSLTDINAGLQTTVALITASAGEFNALGIIIVSSTQMGAMAFVMLQTSVTTSLQTITTTVTVTGTTIQNTVNTTKQGVLSVVRDALNTFNNSVESGMNSAVSSVRSAVSQIQNEVSKLKNAFNFTWSLPKIKLPHFKINGSFSMDPPSAPSFSVDWYKKGGIMTQPTIFGLNGGRAMVGGESGPEAILPLDTFWDKLKTYTQESQIYNNSNTSNTYETVNRGDSHTEYNTYSPQFTCTITGTNDDRSLKRKFKRWFQECIDETFESMARRTE